MTNCSGSSSREIIFCLVFYHRNLTIVTACARNIITENYYRKTIICLTAILLFVYSIKTAINYFHIFTHNFNLAIRLVISLCLVAVWQLVLHEYEWMNEWMDESLKLTILMHYCFTKLVQKIFKQGNIKNIICILDKVLNSLTLNAFLYS